MFFTQKVGDRIAFDMASIDLPREEVEKRLRAFGISVINLNPLDFARFCIGTSHYRKKATIVEAPEFVNCSIFTKWVFGQLGIWLPQLAVQQRDLGDIVPLEDVRGGDLIFTTSNNVRGGNLYRYHSQDDVGHVCIATREGTVVYATNIDVKPGGVIERPLEFLWKTREFRGARRVWKESMVTLVLPLLLLDAIETSDDVWWLLKKHSTT